MASAHTQRTVLLTGSNGLLGQKLVNKLRGRSNLQLIATSRGENRHPALDGYTYEPLDITDFERLQALFEQYKPTEVINAAAMTAVDACEDDRETCDAINIAAVRHLAGLCKEHNTRLIHVSTDFIFDGSEGPYAEDAPANPLSYYGESKWKGEQIIEESGIRAAIVRTVLVYGVVADMSRSNIVLWVKNSLEAGKAIRVVEDQIRTPTLAEDLADGITAILFREKEGIFNLSGYEMMTVYEIALRVADFWKLDRSLISRISSGELNQKAPRPPRTGLIILKAQTELDYQPQDFETGLQIVDKQLQLYAPASAQ